MGAGKHEGGASRIFRLAHPRVGGQELGRDGTGRRSIARTAIRRQVSGGEGGFNLMQPPEVRPHLRREIDERGNRSIPCTFLPGPAQRLPHLPAMSGES
jgi:hypothetical protein